MTPPDTVTQPFRPPLSPPGGSQTASQPTATVVAITPDQARDILARHDHAVSQNRALGLARDGRNRTIRRTDVEKYARDIRQGRWKLNGETIKVTAEGIVADGQHRLLACVQADKPFDTFLVTGVQLDDQATIDAGVKRKISDQLALSGVPNAKTLESIARWSWRWLRGARTRGGYAVPNPSELELLGFIEADERLKLASVFATRAHQQFRPVRASVWGIAWMLLHGKDYLAAEVFLPQVAEGADIGIGHPAHTLRARIMRARDNDERLSEHEQLCLIILSWNAFREDRQISRLSLPKGRLNASNFPEPV